MLDKIEVLDRPSEVNDEMRIRLEPNIISGNDVLTVRDLKKAFDQNLLFEHIGFEVKRGGTGRHHRRQRDRKNHHIENLK